MNSELSAKLVDWALVAFTVVVVTYVVSLPFVWFTCTFWVGMGYRESVRPPPEEVEAQISREFARAELSLPLALWPWFTFVSCVIALGVGRDIYQSFKAQP